MERRCATMKMIFGILVLVIVATSSLPLDGDGKFLTDSQEKLYEKIVMEIRNKSRGFRPDRRVGEKVAKWKPGQGNPEELGSYFEGDILQPPASLTRNGIIDTRYRWPQGVIPYVITGSFTTAQTNMIQSAMNTIQQNTCIRFRQKDSSDYNYVSIGSASTGCWSVAGRWGGGKQPLNLQAPGCVYVVGTAIHELLHTIGFYHEQSRMDRDNYVTINYNNIEPGMANNFDISDTITFGVPYDYGSVMHYGRNFFSKNGLDTIVPKDNWVTIGQRTHLSNSDIAKIRRMYKCYGATSYV